MSEAARKRLCLALVLMIVGAAQAAVDCRSYAAELSMMVSVDAAMRSRWDMAALHQWKGPGAPKIVEQTALIDRRHTDSFKALVRACGWPDKARHGASAVDDSWLIAQHADHDRASQREYFTHVERRIAAGDGSATQFAYLSDRLDAADGKPQRYGTQLEQVSPCEFDFVALDDREQVEARRRALSWPSACGVQAPGSRQCAAGRMPGRPMTLLEQSAQPSAEVLDAEWSVGSRGGSMDTRRREDRARILAATHWPHSEASRDSVFTLQD